MNFFHLQSTTSFRKISAEIKLFFFFLSCIFEDKSNYERLSLCTQLLLPILNLKTLQQLKISDMFQKTKEQTPAKSIIAAAYGDVLSIHISAFTAKLTIQCVFVYEWRLAGLETPSHVSIDRGRESSVLRCTMCTGVFRFTRPGTTIEPHVTKTWSQFRKTVTAPTHLLLYRD